MRVKPCRGYENMKGFDTTFEYTTTGLPQQNGRIQKKM